MPRGIADIVQVVMLAAGPHAFLRRGRPRIRPLLLPGKHILELHHAGIGEQQAGVVARHQAASLAPPHAHYGQKTPEKSREYRYY